jgi:hypothetical protein
MSRSLLEPCPETYDIGPFQFECRGHYPGDRPWAKLHENGLLVHHSTSPRMAGDVELTWWTEVVDDPPPGTAR